MFSEIKHYLFKKKLTQLFAVPVKSQQGLERNYQLLYINYFTGDFRRTAILSLRPFVIYIKKNKQREFK